jgi:hypothetical protein
MGFSRRGNFAVMPQQESDDESRLAAFEAEWVAQWMPTVPQTNSGFRQAVKPAHVGADSHAEVEVVISLRSRPELRIRLQA